MGTMQALRLSLHPLRAPYAAVAGRWHTDAWAGGPGSPLRLRTVPRPELPGAAWARVRVHLGGICASDLKLLHLTAYSPLIAAWADWRAPVIPGHEVVGTVVEAGPQAGVAAGDRVVAEPLLSCRDKGLSLCVACRRGDDHLCGRAADRDGLCKGNGFGFNARFGGGWAEELVAPGWRCIPVPADAGDADAVLTEPLAIALHAVARNPPPAGAKVLVIGPGTVGLCTVLALRALVPGAEVTVAGLDSFADGVAREFGAAHLVHGTRRRLIEALAPVTGATIRKPPVGPPVLDEGFDMVFDCVGTEQTIDDGMRVLRAGGTMVLVGTAGRQSVDWTLVWWRELRIAGTVFYAQGPDGVRAMARAAELLPDLRPGRLVTHRFTLGQAPTALRTASAGPRARAVKVAFVPSAPL
jgi:L-iditol 2-dehydrogenase